MEESLLFAGFPGNQCLVKIAHLLWWHIIGSCSHIYLLVNIKARDDEEHPGTPRTPGQKTTQSEDHSSLVFLIIL